MVAVLSFHFPHRQQMWIPVQPSWGANGIPCLLFCISRDTLEPMFSSSKTMLVFLFLFTFSRLSCLSSLEAFSVLRVSLDLLFSDGLRQPLGKVHLMPQRGLDPQVENHCPREIYAWRVCSLCCPLSDAISVLSTSILYPLGTGVEPLAHFLTLMVACILEPLGFPHTKRF